MFVSCLGKSSPYLVERGFSAAASLAFFVMAGLSFGSQRGTPIANVYRLRMTAPSYRSTQT
jgi:hypothetical protein